MAGLVPAIHAPSIHQKPPIMTRHVVARAEDIPPGQRKIVTVKGREIGIFNVGGDFHGTRAPNCARARLSAAWFPPRPATTA
jgi:hypothetical protein